MSVLRGVYEYEAIVLFLLIHLCVHMEVWGNRKLVLAVYQRERGIDFINSPSRISLGMR